MESLTYWCSRKTSRLVGRIVNYSIGGGSSSSLSSQFEIPISNSKILVLFLYQIK